MFTALMGESAFGQLKKQHFGDDSGFSLGYSPTQPSLGSVDSGFNFTGPASSEAGPLDSSNYDFGSDNNFGLGDNLGLTDPALLSGGTSSGTPHAVAVPTGSAAAAAGSSAASSTNWLTSLLGGIGSAASTALGTNAAAKPGAGVVAPKPASTVAGIPTGYLLLAGAAVLAFFVFKEEEETKRSESTAA